MAEKFLASIMEEVNSKVRPVTSTRRGPSRGCGLQLGSRARGALVSRVRCTR